MKTYNYLEAMSEDIKNALFDTSGEYFSKAIEGSREYIDYHKHLVDSGYLLAENAEAVDLIREYIENVDSSESFQEFCYEQMWVDDSITGNASGSYTFNTWKAEENLCHNSELLWDALAEFGSCWADTSNGAEWCDVTIRCHLLSRVLAEVLDDVAEDLAKAVAEYL